MTTYSNKSSVVTVVAIVFFTLLLAHNLVLADTTSASSKSRCLLCHANKISGFSDKHAFAATQCTTCHKGDNAASDLPQAHKGLIAYPGDMKHAETACGACHAKRVNDVTHSLMNTGKGIVASTRHAFDEPLENNSGSGFNSLAHTPADSLMRKLCASCHMANSKSKHALDVTFDRGGGCSACHINSYPPGQHPALSSRVEDGRCFGCHSRSGRISLNYAGLAEIIPDELTDNAVADILQLADGRKVVKRPADVHYKAGMSCIDCHTSTGLMGGNDNTRHQQQAVDIRCTDCHNNESAKVTLSSWPEKHDSLKQYIEGDRLSQQPFLTTAHSATPLWNIRLQQDGAALLQPKLGGPALPVPAYTAASHPLAEEHQRLHCSACHSQWAPQCYGCHTEYDPQATQKDHLLNKQTEGRWKEQRWDVRSDLPPLGVTKDDVIKPFVPGMIMTIAHPDWPTDKFRRRFAPSEPHTTGKSRSCESCHRSSIALGLGQGAFKKTGNEWTFIATEKSLEDGLAADAWTALEQATTDQPVSAGSRPFKHTEILRILEAGQLKSFP